MRGRRGGAARRGGAEGKRKRPTVQSVERAARIMGALFASGTRGRRVTDLSEELGLHKTTVVRLLQTLVAIGVVKKDADSNRYRCDLLTWVAVMSRARELVSGTDIVQDTLKELAKASGVTALLARPDPWRRNVGFVAIADPSDLPVPYHYWYLGASWPAHATASGKACLAGLSEAELEQWMREQRLEALTDQTIVSPERLRRELERCRKLGYAVQRGESSPGMCSVAVPVRDPKGRVVGAIATTGPSTLMTADKMQRSVPLLKESSEKLSRLLYEVFGENSGLESEEDARGAGRSL